jgi:hypothetical protein
MHALHTPWQGCRSGCVCLPQPLLGRQASSGALGWLLSKWSCLPYYAQVPLAADVEPGGQVPAPAARCLPGLIPYVFRHCRVVLMLCLALHSTDDQAARCRETLYQARGENTLARTAHYQDSRARPRRATYS